MTIDDNAPRPDTPLDALVREDLSTLSRSELTERIRALENEIGRTRSILASKSDHASTAESLFRKG